MLRLNATLACTRPVPSDPFDLTGSRGWVALGSPAMVIVAAGFWVVK